ncbi:MAG TPA: type II CAAX endopeptidase family protein [Sedimentibacter sp.]|jgi:membrane protease YdiL (CAAX protease family)|nr:type II CAAX endopeptidase family protein [Sedimentibacter sp.]
MISSMELKKKMKKTKNYMFLYIVYTYGLFALLLIVLGGIGTILFNGTPLVMKWVVSITAWTPTYVFLLMFKKLYPDSTLKEFYKNAFSKKINIRLLATTTLIQTIIFLLSVYMISVQNGVSVFSLLNFSNEVIIPTLFIILIQGPTGEETGWRGYLQPAIEEKFGVVKGSLIVGLIWAFWHAPIWFLGTGYYGTELLKYIIVFFISIASLGFIIGLCYHYCKNLFIPIWMHFVLNFLSQTCTGSQLDMVTWYAVFYLITAIGFALYHKLRLRKG